MGHELHERIRKSISEGKSIETIRFELVSEGFLEDELVDAIQEVHGQSKSHEDKKNTRLFATKEVLDRLGYGFASIQFINILFFLTGASLLLIGVINGLKTVVSVVISSFLQEYSKVRKISNRFMSWSGVLFGLSFLFISIAVILSHFSQFWSLTLFSISLVVGSVGVVTYGDLYERLMEDNLKKEKLGKFLLRISHFGVLITGVSILLSGFLFDKFPLYGAAKVMIFGKSLPLQGYVISFEITAICFILSGYFIQFIRDRKSDTQQPKGFLADYYLRVREQAKHFTRNKYLFLLLLASSIAGLVQILGNSYYGIFVYKTFEDAAFGGFLNVAIIAAFAIIISFIGPAFSVLVNKKVGLAPTLVFGSLLLAMMPLACAYNPHFLAVGFSNALSVLGSAILGMGQGLLVRKMLSEEQRKLFFAGLSFGVIVPFIILIPAGAVVAQLFGLQLLFKILALVLVCVAAPLYFVLVVMANKLKL